MKINIMHAEIFLIVGLIFNIRCIVPPPQPVPPLLKSPTIDTLELIGIKIQGKYRETIRIRWSPPNTDSISIKEFHLIRAIDQDTSYDSVVSRIPFNVYEFFDIIENGIGFPEVQSYRHVYYKIFAIDSLGRSSDSSNVKKITLAWQPLLLYPKASDTLRANILKWGIEGMQGPYFAFPILWSESKGIIWQGTRGLQPLFGVEGVRDSTMALPPSILPLTKGVYYFGVKFIVEDSYFGWPQSLKICEFYVKDQ